MREYLLLVKLQLLSLFGINKARFASDAAEKKRVRKNLFLLAVMVIALGNASATYTLLLMEALPGAEADALTLMTAAISAFLVLISMLSVRNVLYAFGDFDAIMSWPVSRTAVSASRVTGLYAYNLAYSLLFLLPMIVLYAVRMRPGVSFILAAAALMPVLPLLPTALGILIGTALTAATAGMKKSALMHTAFQMLLALGIMFFSVRMSNTSGMVWTGAAASTARVYPPAAWFTKALGGDAGALLTFAGLGMIAIFAAGFVAAKLLFRLSSRLSAAPGNAKQSGRTERARSSLAALYRLEWKRYLASSVYVTNTAFGEIILVLLAVFAAVKRAEVLAFLALPGMEVSMELLPLIMALPICMAATTPVAVSMEGKRLWIVKSLPVRTEDFLLSKILVSVTPALPAIVLSATLVGLSLGVPAKTFALLYALPAGYAFLMAALGLWINLLLPKLDWKNEVEAVKQGISEFFAVLISLLLTGGPAVVAFALQNADFLPVLAAALFVLAGVVYRLLIGWAHRRLTLLNVS